MKIGILTFHFAHNYGAVLQVYALQEKLKELGHDVEIIDYRPSYLIDSYKLPSLEFKSKSPVKIISRFLSIILLNNSRAKRIKKFNDFIETNLNLNCQTNIIPKDYNLYILGSDQIWNCYLTKGIDNVYWGDFLKKTDSKIITYAASIGSYKIQEDKKYIIKKLLSNIDKISVREKDTIEEIRNLTNKEIIEVLDPTFLIEKTKWDQLSISSLPKKKYILVYQLGYNKNLIKIANKIAEQIHGTVIEVPATITLRYLFNKNKATSPIEFINLIKNAECIVTSSFHGTAFSIIFEKPFYTIALNDGSDNRSRNLLENLSLDNRMIGINSKVDFSHIDYTLANKKLQKLISNSKSYLKSFL